jgi:hypothetical protein
MSLKRVSIGELMKRDAMIKQILKNAEEINRLTKTISETFDYKSADEQAWHRATEEFHAAYDRLAFPGGLKEGLERLKRHDPSAIELAVTYLEANPYHFRSGYNKEKIAQFLKQAPLTDDQKQRLLTVIAAAASDKDQRKLRVYKALEKVIKER